VAVFRIRFILSKEAIMMRRIFVLAVLFGAFTAPSIFGYTITVDGDPTDWLMTSPAAANLGHICRNATSNGEYLWKDEGADERTDFSNPDTRIDLLEFRVTADQSNLYFMGLMTDIDQSEGNGAPQVQVAIDLDRSSGSGTEWLGGNSDTQVDVNAEWEYLAITRFGSNNADVILWGPGGFVGPAFVGSEAISTITETIEFSIPWSAMEIMSFPRWVRFTVVTFRANQSDDTWDTGGGSTSDALDAVTNYGDPGMLSTNTWTEVSDGVVNYYFDVWFDPDTEPFPPVVVAGALPNCPTPEPNSEFMRIFNVTPGAIALDNYKIGDEEVYDGTEGMVRFPVMSSIGSGVLQSIGNTADDVNTAYGFLPDYELTSPGNAAVPDMSAYPNWATGSVSLSNSGDHVLVLDGSDTVIDVLVWGSQSYTGIGVISAPAEDYEVVRTPFNQDTNDCNVDFTTVYVPVELTTFTACATPEGVELRWETASEEDNLGFDIHRGTDEAVECINNEIIPGAGTTLESQSYVFVDDDVDPGASYSYWLEQIDFSGNTERFGPVSVTIPISLPTAMEVMVSPTPLSNGTGIIHLSLPSSGNVRIALYDLAGRELETIWSGESDAGSLAVDWDASEMTQGSYMVRVFSNAGSIVTPVVIR
jgi:hypothetical protein